MYNSIEHAILVACIPKKIAYTWFRKRFTLQYLKLECVCACVCACVRVFVCLRACVRARVCIGKSSKHFRFTINHLNLLILLSGGSLLGYGRQDLIYTIYALFRICKFRFLLSTARRVQSNVYHYSIVSSETSIISIMSSLSHFPNWSNRGSQSIL